MRRVVLLALLVCCLVGASVAQTAAVGCQAFYDNLSEPYDVATDSNGTLYIADHGAQTVIKLAASGTGSVLTNYATTSPALAYPDGLCLDSTGNVYVADGNNQRVVRFNNDGSSPTVIASASTTNPPLNYPWNCAVDSTNSNIFISNTVGAYQGIAKISLTQTGFPQVGYFSNNGTGGQAFLYPNQVAVDSSNNIYVADSNHFHVTKLNGSTGLQQQIYPTPTGGFPNGVAVDSNGTVYVSDTVDGQVMVFSNSGANVFNLTTTNPPMRSPRGVWVDSNFNVFVADSGNVRIVKFYSAQSGFTGGFSGCSAPPSASQVNGYNVAQIFGTSSGSTNTNFNNPYDVALDSSNNIYVADTNNNRVVKLGSGTSSTYGNIQQTYTTSSPSLSAPNGVCLDSANNVYVVDTNNQRVVKFTNAGTVSQTFSTFTPPLQQPWNCAVDGNGNLYVSNTNGQVVNVVSSSGAAVAFYNVSLLYPNQIALDSAGFLYIADSNDARVAKVNTNTSTVVQNFTVPAGTYPNGVAVDSSGNVYVSATTRASVYVFNSAGALQTTFAMANTTLPLNNPRGLAVDSSGSIYVADAVNSRVVIFQKPGSSGAGSVMQQSAATWVVLALAALLSLVISL